MRKTNKTAYAIYKSRDGKDVHAVYVFTQEEHNHRAKAAAKERLEEMWWRACHLPNRFRRLEAGKDSFAYDHMTSVNTTERVRFHIAKHKISKPV